MYIKGDAHVNKLILLFVFDKMENSALSEHTILDMCTSTNDWINYMDCIQIIRQLLEHHFICTVKSQGEDLYTITPDGRSCLANFYFHIPISIREEISQFIKMNGSRYRTKQECKADYYQNKDGTYTVFLRILAPLQPMLELKCVVPNRKIAQTIYKSWDTKAPDLYATIYENLVD